MVGPVNEILTDYDPAEHLDTPEAILALVKGALQTEDAAGHFDSPRVPANQISRRESRKPLGQEGS